MFCAEGLVVDEGRRFNEVLGVSLEEEPTKGGKLAVGWVLDWLGFKMDEVSVSA